eukprot:94293_1
MCANQESIKWILLNSCPCQTNSSMAIPTGIDRNNYLVVEYDFVKINCIYKYDIDNDKWIKINGFNNMENISSFSAALDVKKQILFLLSLDYVTQIQKK